MTLLSFTITENGHPYNYGGFMQDRFRIPTDYTLPKEKELVLPYKIFVFSFISYFLNYSYTFTHKFLKYTKYYFWFSFFPNFIRKVFKSIGKYTSTEL